MKRREIVPMTIGLLVGVLLGSVMMGTSTSLREGVFGTSVDTPDTDGQSVLGDVEFYLADMESTRDWLVSLSPEDSEQIQTALEELVSLPDSPNFRQDFQSAREDLDLVLPRLYDNLGAPLADDDMDKAKLSACLGMNDDPYSPAPTLYFYLTVPKLDTSDVEVPSQWRKLDQPQSNTLFWQLLDCYPPAEDSGS